MSIPVPKQGIELLIIANIMRRPFVMMIKEKLGFVKNWEGQEHIVCGSDDKPSLFEVERGSVASTVGLCGQEGSPKMEAASPPLLLVFTKWPVREADAPDPLNLRSAAPD